MDLSATREGLVKQLADHEAVLASVRAEYHGLLNEGAAVSSLPDDILAIIFEEAHESQVEGDFSRVELEISHVCRRWREFALRLPRLWSKIRREQEQVNLGPVEAYLRRSQESPVSLEISVEYHEYAQDLAAFYSLVAPHLPRCRHLYLSCPSASCWLPFAEMIQAGKLPLLSRVRLCDVCGDESVKTAAEASPALTALRLTNADIGAFPLSLASITHLRIDGVQLPSATHFRYGFFDMPCLTHLELAGSYGAEWAEGWDVQLPRLRVLSIHALGRRTDADFVLLVLKALRMPALEVLSLEGSAQPSAFDVIDVSGAPFQPFPALRHLVLTGNTVPMRYLPLVLPSVAAITHRDRALGSLPAVLRLVKKHPARGLPGVVFWPHLATLTLPAVQPAELAGLREPLRIRRDAGYPLRALFVPDAAGAGDMPGAVRVAEYMGTVRDPTRYFE